MFQFALPLAPGVWALLCGVLVAASVAHYAIGRLTKQGCGARWSRPERERRNGTGLLLGSSW